MWQRLGQLEDARHVWIPPVTSELVVVEAVSEGGEQLSASKAINRCVCKGQAAYLSFFSTVFSLMQAPIMMPEATPSFLPDRLIDSTGLTPLSLSIGSAWPSSLRIREAAD